jgi:hypothetical protein
MSESNAKLEGRIAEWRAYVARGEAIVGADVDELEEHLREQIESLGEAGLDADEAFLVSVKRMGSLSALSREFAREHSERLWRQLVLGDAAPAAGRLRSETTVVLVLAALAAAALKVPELFGLHLVKGAEDFYLRNLAFFVLPFLGTYLAWKRRLGVAQVVRLLAPFAAAALVINLYPFRPGAHTGYLAALHLPIVLWLVAGLAYAGLRWRDSAERMHFVRFSGELFIYYVLIALGGGVLAGFTVMMFKAIGINAVPFVSEWLLPCGGMGAVIVGAWLVEAKQGVIETMAPVLTRLFTPLFTLFLLAYLGTMVWTHRGINVERETLIGLDLLLVVVLGILLYAVSARDPRTPPGPFDVLQLTLVVATLIVDVVALAAIAARLSAFGFTPNRCAALGENLVLLVNLAGSAWLHTRFARGKIPFAAVERWQTSYLPVFALWALVVVVVFPLAFRFE